MRNRDLLRHVAITAAVAAASGLAVLGAVWAGTAAYQAEHPPTCFGIGWGCELDPASTAGFMGILIVGPAFVLIVVTLLVGLIVSSRREGAVPWVRRWSTAVRVLSGAAATLAWLSAASRLL